MKRILAVAVATLGLMVSSSVAAAATPPGDPAAQAAGQAATSGQGAGALSGASQSQPANQNISVRVLSPGGNGDVTQSNTVSSNATAANANATDQSADQTQAGSCGCADGGTQAIGQESKSDQAAAALSLASQQGASNTNIPVRVLSPGDDGEVSQTNSVESDATAANLNATGQEADQAASGSGTQAIGQEAKSDQDAVAASKAEQSGAKNTNISVRVLSPGDDGSVDQSNSVASSATAANLNLTGQRADQAQGGSGGTQAIGQRAKSDQSAGALSAAEQKGASNTNTPVRVLSRGDGGDVTQSNSVDSSATAANLNETKQAADQTQAGRCGCASDGIQAIGQESKNEQGALAASLAAQGGGHDRCGCSAGGNTNAPVRVDSDGHGGSVEQSNTVDSSANAANLNALHQGAAQDQSGSGGIQAIGQESKNEQAALALSAASQHGASNTNTPVRVASKGDDGDVSQSNAVASAATALNANLTSQDADQSQRGSSQCGCHGIGIQALGQSAKSEQGALAASLAAQAGASNANAPVRVDSYGHGGSVDQSNDVASTATAANLNALHQDAEQHQAGGGGIAIQALGQSASNEQHAIGLSAALQHGASNGNTPVAVGSWGHAGDVWQSNAVSSSATALNANLTKQDADQHQSGSGCRCSDSVGIQAVGQEAKNGQGALAASLAAQAGGRQCGCGSNAHWDELGSHRLNPLGRRWMLE